MGYSVPEVESAPTFFLESYPQVYPQAVDGAGDNRSAGENRTRGIEWRAGLYLYSPNKYFD